MAVAFQRFKPRPKRVLLSKVMIDSLWAVFRLLRIAGVVGKSILLRHVVHVFLSLESIIIRRARGPRSASKPRLKALVARSFQRRTPRLLAHRWRRFMIGFSQLDFAPAEERPAYFSTRTTPRTTYPQYQQIIKNF